MANCLQIVSATLLVAFMSGNRCVPGRAGQVFAILVWNVLALRVPVAFSKTEINNVNCIFGVLGTANKEIVGLDISVDNPLFMHLLNTLNELYRNLKASFQIELSSAGLKEILE